MSSGLENVLRAISGGQPAAEQAPIPDSLVIQKLTEASQRYAAIGCPFSVGDLITPRTDAHIGGHGTPFVVLEVFEEHVRPRGSTQNTISSAYNAKFDMRVGHMVSNVIAAHCVESWEFEIYTGPAVAADTPRN